MNLAWFVWKVQIDIVKPKKIFLFLFQGIGVEPDEGTPLAED